MGAVLDFEQPFRERMLGNVIGDMGKMFQQAGDIAEEYQQLMRQYPNEAIDKLPEFIDRIRDINPERAYESLAGGPCEKWIGPVLNIFGEVYPELNRESRKKGLKLCINFLDDLRYDYAQNKLEVIQEPWLATDIVITRPIYWCGYKEYCDFADTHQKWKDFSKGIGSVKSAFWLAMGVVQHKHTSLEVRQNFYERYPVLMERTKDAIAAMAAVYGGRKAVKENISVDEGIDKWLNGVDSLLYNDIRTKIEEKKWILLPD